ncbi:hypothetical protein ABPG72_004195 [Tetrahymena utriculariae]
MQQHSKDIFTLQEAVRLKVLLQKNNKSEKNKDEINGLCKKILLFDHLVGTQFYEQVISKLECKELKANYKFFQNLKDKDYIYIVLLGQVDVILELKDKLTDQKEERLMNSFGFGEFFWWDEDQYTDHRGQVAVKCLDDAEIIQINKSLFDSYSQKLEKQGNQCIIDFIKNIKVFENFNSDILNDIVSKSTLKQFQVNTLILREEDLPGYVYIILKGQCTCLKKVAMRRFDYPHLEDLEELVKSPSKQEMQGGEFDYKLFETDFIKPGEFFGSNEIINQQEIEYSILTTEPTDILMIPRLEFLGFQQKILFPFQKEAQKVKEELELIEIKGMTKKEQKERQFQEIRLQYYMKNNWETFKKNTIQNTKHEQKYNKNQFDNLLRQKFNFNRKKDYFIPDEQAHKKIQMTVNLPPINNNNKKVFRPNIFTTESVIDNKF